MPLPEPSEEVLERLIKRYLAGDTQICQKLLERPQFYKMVENLAKKFFLGTPYSWEDATQIAFEKVLKAARAGQFRQGNVDYFYRWSLRVAHNCIRDLVRKNNRENLQYRTQSLNQTLSLDTETTLDQLKSSSINLWESIENADTFEQIEAAVQRIHQQYPQKDFLQIWEGLAAEKKQTEIAKMLEVKQAEVSKRKQELAFRVGKELGWFSVQELEEKLKQIRQGKPQSRSQQQW